MKKILGLFVIGILLVMLSSCGKNNIGHTHDLEQVGAKAATCMESGYDAYEYCKSCDYTTYNEISALGHNLTHHEALDATCIEDGYEAYDTCSRCDYTTYTVCSSLGHNLTHHEALAATCTEEGHKAYDTCSRCNYTTYEVIEALGHDETHHEGLAATCLEAGYKAYDTCSRCSYTTYETIKALGHSLDLHSSKNATCTEIGYNSYAVCSRCEWTNYREIPALGHIEIHHEGLAATCEESGYDAYDTCYRCDYTTYNKIEALGHDVIHHDAKKPNCIAGGWNAYDTCSRCDYSTHEELMRLTETAMHTVTTKTVNGKETKVCSVCGMEDNTAPKVEFYDSEKMIWIDFKSIDGTYYMGNQIIVFRNGICYLKNTLTLRYIDDISGFKREFEKYPGEYYTFEFEYHDIGGSGSYDASDTFGNVNHFEIVRDNDAPRISLNASVVRGVCYYLNSADVSFYDGTGVGLKTVYIQYLNKTITYEFTDAPTKVVIPFHHAATFYAEDLLGNKTPKNYGEKIERLYLDSDDNIYPIDAGLQFEKEFTFYSKVDATSTSAGHYSYYYCPHCKLYFSSEAVLREKYDNEPLEVSNGKLNQIYCIGDESDLKEWLSSSGEGYIAPVV